MTGLNAIGLHIIGGTTLPLANGNARPGIVKLVDPSAAYVQSVRMQVGPDALIVIRWYEANQDISTPISAANSWFNRHRASINAMMGANVLFEGLNEIADSSAPLFYVYELERGRLLHSIGARVGYFSFSVGAPDIPVWATYQPVLAAMRPGDVVCLHEYASDLADVDNRWHCGRWTKVPQLTGKPIAITEFGLDVVEGKGKPGWQLTTDANGMMAVIRKYSTLMAQCPNVKGCTVYQVGAIDAQWKPFDVTSIWVRVVAEYGKVAPPITTPPPIPTPLTGGQPVTLTIDGRCMNEQGFIKHLDTLKMTSAHVPTRVYLHHTAIPTLASWRGAETIEGMRRYYQDTMKWDAGPHIFVGPDGIWLFTPLNQQGIGVTSHNFGSIHLEMVGDYSTIRPSGAVLELTCWCLAAMFKRFVLDYNGLRLHRDDETTTCPGGVVLKTWIVPLVGKMRTAQGGFGLPTGETATDAKTLVQKARWWLEERRRAAEAGFMLRADDIELSNIQLMIRSENAPA